MQRKLAIRAVGICVPGIVQPKTGRVWAPNIPGWDDYPLKAEIKAAVSDQAIKVAIDSDRSASILGEAWQGAARGCRNAIFLAVGTGIGAGILVDGRVLHGEQASQAHRLAGARSPLPHRVHRLRVFRVARLGRRNCRRSRELVTKHRGDDDDGNGNKSGLD